MRILVMYSWDDDISQMRWSRKTSDPELASFEIAQCFALPSEDANVHGPSIARRLSDAIDGFRPDILLIHTGAAFHRSPEAFAECMRLITQTFPMLRLGFEHRSYGANVLQDAGVFETSAEMQDIERRFFSR